MLKWFKSCQAHKLQTFSKAIWIDRVISKPYLVPFTSGIHYIICEQIKIHTEMHHKPVTNIIVSCYELTKNLGNSKYLEYRYNEKTSLITM